MRFKLPAAYCLLVLLAGLVPARSQTPLGILPAQNQVILFWTTNAYGFTLQAATNLSQPVWSTALPAPVVVSGNYTVTNAIAGAGQFYRLAPAGMALVPAGSFTMGDTLDAEPDAIPVSVTLSAFYMDENLVTEAQWQEVHSWALSHRYVFDNAGTGKATNQPVYNVNWYDMVKWCNARSQQAGLPPAYYTDAGLTSVYTSGDTDFVYVNWSAPGYRLPTEAEWEKAARGGLSGQRFPWGNTISESRANYYGDTATNYDLGPNGYNSAFETGAQPYTSPAGHFAPNGYGLCDMAGNDNQWCWDWYGTPYSGGVNPHGPASGSYRTLRGGDYIDNAYFERCANRNNHSHLSSSASIYIGFRCVIGL